MRACNREGDELSVASVSRETNAKLVSIVWVDHTVAHRTAGRGNIIDRGECVVEGKVYLELAVGAATAAFDSDRASQRQIDVEMALVRECCDQFEPTFLATVCRLQNGAGRADCDSGQAIAGKVHVKQIEEGSARLPRPGEAEIVRLENGAAEANREPRLRFREIDSLQALRENNRV